MVSQGLFKEEITVAFFGKELICITDVQLVRLGQYPLLAVINLVAPSNSGRVCLPVTPPACSLSASAAWPTRKQDRQ